MTESQIREKLKWEIFRFCIQPKDVADWIDLCKQPGWPKHRAKEVFDRLFDDRMAALKDLFDRDCEAAFLYLWFRLYEEKP